ncbi:DUF2178 domain-containing protein [Natronobacterium texcoconense]|uniref:Predicted membrane protein n=1 Tax=Natronobacterium texcoconense TaxID=1095778 RepID=A0A1H0ZCK9_NATTX|nr:DUF2178 domain-containing protein [Natronobacterium texcoconense]SDQ24846.1 Predicted membrane protein [Natronobacterium texcoconense]
MSDTMLPTASSPERTRRRYERLVYGIFAIAIVGLLAGLVIGQQLAGTAIYLVGVWLGAVVAYLVPTVSNVRFYDERDERLVERASSLTMSVAFVVGISIVPALYVLGAAGYVTITETMWGGIYVASALFLLWGLCYGIVTHR